MEGVPGWFENAGYIVLACALLFGAAELYWAWRHRSARYDSLYEAAGLLWAVGLGCKMAGLGPEFFRFWLADIGFPILIAWGQWDLVRAKKFRRERRGAGTHKVRLALNLRQVAERKVSLIIGVGVSYVYEVGAGFIVRAVKANVPPGTELGIGDFDWFDILAYTAGGLIGWLILWRWQVFLEGYKDWAVQQDAQTARARARQRAADRRAAERRRRSGK